MEKTLIIHPTDGSTDDLKLIYESLSPREVITDTRDRNGTVAKLREADRVICLGHGLPQGLIGTGTQLCIDASHAGLFAEKPDTIFIWCNANVYLQRHHLSGFCTGMFISEAMEAHVFNVEASPEQITFSNRLFSRLVSEAIAANMCNEEMAEFVLAGYNDSSNEAIVYNRQRIYAFYEGAVTVGTDQISYSYRGHRKISEAGSTPRLSLFT